MTANERIEELVSAFGQTIDDLPKPENGRYAYDYDTRRMARLTAYDFNECSVGREDECVDYICHLADIIDRMEIALSTAKLVMDCSFCSKGADEWCDSDGPACRVSDLEFVDGNVALQCYDFDTNKWDVKKLEALLNDRRRA